MAKSVEVYSEEENGKRRSQITIIEKTQSKLNDLIEMFDFHNLDIVRKENEGNLSDMVPKLYLEQAYIIYILMDNARAYRYLKNCSKLFYSNKEYMWYFISEVNQKNIGRIIERDFGEF